METILRTAPKGILKKAFSFSLIGYWADELFDASNEFYNEFSIYPNIMSAMPGVYQEIDTLILEDLNNVINDQGEHPKPGSIVSLAAFTTDNCEIEFTLNDITPYPGFLLIYDEDPSFDGEPETVNYGIIMASRYHAA